MIIRVYKKYNSDAFVVYYNTSHTFDIDLVRKVLVGLEFDRVTAWAMSNLGYLDNVSGDFKYCGMGYVVNMSVCNIEKL